MPHESTAFMLLQVAERIGLPALRVIAGQVGVSSAYRVTLYYPDIQAVDVVATLTATHGTNVLLTTYYSGLFGGRPLQREFSATQFAAFRRELRPSLFDRLDDQPNIPYYGVPLCLIERASGAFYKNVVLAPDRAEGVYADLVDLVRRYVPEVFRAIPRS